MTLAFQHLIDAPEYSHVFGMCRKTARIMLAAEVVQPVMFVLTTCGVRAEQVAVRLAPFSPN